MLREVFAPWGIETSFVDMTDSGETEHPPNPESTEGM